jgi:hypothetical protein
MGTTAAARRGDNIVSNNVLTSCAALMIPPQLARCLDRCVSAAELVIGNAVAFAATSADQTWYDTIE